MTIVANAHETDALLKKFGLNAMMIEAAGGILAAIAGYESSKGHREIALVIGARRVVVECPVSEEAAQTMVAELRRAGAIPHDVSFEHLIKHLFEKFSALYAEGDIDAFSIPKLHLHPTSYQIEKGQIWHTAPVEIVPRRNHKKPVLHQSFPHQTKR